jgi:hypothetical protein
LVRGKESRRKGSKRDEKDKKKIIFFYLMCGSAVTSEKETDRLYHKQSTEMAADMIKTGTIADRARATQIEEQVM